MGVHSWICGDHCTSYCGEHCTGGYVVITALCRMGNKISSCCCGTAEYSTATAKSHNSNLSLSTSSLGSEKVVDQEPPSLPPRIQERKESSSSSSYSEEEEHAEEKNEEDDDGEEIKVVEPS